MPPQRELVEEGVIQETISKAQSYLSSSDGTIAGIPRDKEVIRGLLNVARDKIRGIMGSTPELQSNYQKKIDSLISQVEAVNFPEIQWTR